MHGQQNIKSVKMHGTNVKKIYVKYIYSHIDKLVKVIKLVFVSQLFTFSR